MGWKSLAIGKNEIIFGSIFILLTAAVRFSLEFFEFGESASGSIFYAIISRFGFMIIIGIATIMYFRNSENKQINALKWGVTLFLFDVLDLVFLESISIRDSFTPHLFSDYLMSVILILYYSIISSLIGACFYFILLYKKEMKLGYGIKI